MLNRAKFDQVVRVALELAGIEAELHWWAYNRQLSVNVDDRLSAGFGGLNLTYEEAFDIAIDVYDYLYPTEAMLWCTQRHSERWYAFNANWEYEYHLRRWRKHAKHRRWRRRR